MPPSAVSACAGGSPSGHTPSSSARRSSGLCDSRTRSLRWWSNVGYRKKRSCSRAKCFSGSRMPPLRSVRSCSPSASARTVTAHSLNAIGIFRRERLRQQKQSRRVTALDPRSVRRDYPHSPKSSPKPQTCLQRATFLASKSPVCEAFVGFEQGRKVVCSMTSEDRCRQRVGSRGGRGKRDVRRLGVLEAQPDVLEHVLGLEERRVVVVAHRAGLERQHRARSRPCRHHVDERVEVEALR